MDLGPRPAATPAPATAEERLFSRGRGAPIAGAVALISMLAFEALAVAAAMPAVATALDGLASYAMAFGAPLALSVLGMVMAGQSCDRHGPLRATTLGLGLFTAGLLVAGLAGSMGHVVLGRMLQGLGGGMLGVTLYVGMGQVVPAALHPRLFSLFATAWVLPGLVGPSLAAALVDHVGWRSVFLLVAAAAPPTAALLLPALASLHKSEPTAAAPETARPRTRVQLAWAVLAASGALLLHQAGQTAFAASGLVMLAAGIVAVLGAASQLLPRGSLVAAPGLPAVIALRGLMAAAFATAEVFLPLLLTRDQGWTLAQAGMALSVGAVSWSTGSAVQSKLAQPRQRRAGLVLGFALLGLGIAGVAAQAAAGGHGAWVLVAWALAGFGIGLGFPMLSVLTLALSTPGTSGQNASALQLSDALTCSAALAVAGALQAATANAGPSWLVLLLAATLAFVGAGLGRRAFAERG